METIIQRIKDYLVRLGPESPLVRAALWLYAHRHGYGLSFANGSILLRKDRRELMLGSAHYVQLPTMIDCYDTFFNTIESEIKDDRIVLDFSKPNLHRYIKSHAAFYFPSIPEEDQISVYTHSYIPQPGDVVWDVGAHAGATTYFLAQMVGPLGKVYAFEPDEQNYDCLTRNIALHKLHNVFPVKKALSGVTGIAKFNMDGTMCAGLSEYLLYSDERLARTVPTITISDACAEFGETPKYIKMDIEGAETIAIEGSKTFLQDHPIHFAIESYHRVGGEFTYIALERMFLQIGYGARSSNEFGQMFTWAEPRL